MKRKYIDRAGWKRLKRSTLVHINEYHPRFEGYASAVFIDEARERLVLPVNGQRLCLVDDGYVWMQRLPEGKHWALTTVIDDQDRVVQWYFDITRENGVDDAGRPYYDDLYLDIVALPSGDVTLLDEDELREACDRGDISVSDMDLAYVEAEELMRGLAKDVPALLRMAREDLAFFRAKLGENGG